jgi:hypothetical protein
MTWWLTTKTSQAIELVANYTTALSRHALLQSCISFKLHKNGAMAGLFRTIIKSRGLWYPNVNGKTFAIFRTDPRNHLVSLGRLQFHPFHLH